MLVFLKSTVKQKRIVSINLLASKCGLRTPSEGGVVIISRLLEGYSVLQTFLATVDSSDDVPTILS